MLLDAMAVVAIVAVFAIPIGGMSVVGIILFTPWGRKKARKLARAVVALGYPALLCLAVVWAYIFVAGLPS